MDTKKTAIFGATGYIGLILVNRLAEQGVPLKLFVRNKRRLNYLKTHDNISSCDLDLTYDNQEQLAEELKECDVIYYLIHSMQPSATPFEDSDLRIASIVAKACYSANIRQMIYLGGLGMEQEGHPLSMHLKSRQDTADMMRSYGINVTELRAGVIIGAGSVSFEIMRSLGNKLPFIIKLRFNTGRCHPIDVDDVIQYLINAAENEQYFGRIVEIGMEWHYSYDEMIELYIRQIKQRQVKKINLYGLERLFSKKIVSRIIAFVSAIPYELAMPLVAGMDSMAVKEKYNILEIDNTIKPIGLSASIKKASNYENEGRVESFWSIPTNLQVLSKTEETFLYVDHYEEHGLLFEQRVRSVRPKDVKAIFDEVKHIGGEHGYWSPQWMWRVRAKFDKFIGGPGMTVGRRNREHEMRIGSRLDFWIVSDYLDKDDKKVLTLKGRLKSPGNSWLQFALIKDEQDLKGWKFMLRAYFEPFGLGGYLYWYSLFFVHKYIFTKMIDTILQHSLKKTL